jgi:regulatory protein
VVTPKRRNVLGGPGAEPLDARAARVVALDALARRDQPAAALRRKLLDKGYDAAVVDPLIERLRAEKLIDDDRYVENFVAYHAARGQGPLRVRSDLRKLGVQGALVENAIEAYPDWIVQLRLARQKKFGAQLPSHYADGQRQARFLGFRGFTGAQIRLALGFDTDLDVDS